MAAQEKAKQAKATPTPQQQPPAMDWMAPPATEAPAAATASAPPPTFDPLALPPPAAAAAEAPPSFDSVENTLAAPPPAAAVANDPPPAYNMAPPAPSAPSFEDLLGGTVTAPPPPAPLDGMEQMQPPSTASDHPQAFAEEFAGLEGLSEEEKAALLEEQRQIMEAIERSKAGDQASEAVAAAEAFDQRSNAAVARIAGAVDSGGARSPQRTVQLGENQSVKVHGQERTRAAIADGTALLIQCVNCNNWMQVTDNATLMYCPVCSVVSPVDHENAATSKEEALQMEADRKLAEELQKEEYAAGERAEQRAQQRRQQREEERKKQQQAKQGESWWDWLGMGSTPATAGPQPQQTQPRHRGDLGVALPPGASGGRLQSATTGAEGSGPDLSFARSASYDSAEERQFLNTGAGAARVAEQKPLFSCIADSITTTASSLSTALNAQTLDQDGEGNVHGVDSSSLLVVSQAGRNSGNNPRPPGPM